MKKYFSLFFLLSFSIASQAIELTKLTCEFQTSPLAVNTLQPRFGWQMISDKNGTMQAAYELEIKGENSEWNSKKINSDKSQLVKCSGNQLKSGEKYSWRVRVWNEDNEASKWSDWSEFRISPLTPFLEERAKWIGAIRSDSARIPVGKRFLSWDMGTPEYKAVWKN
ncbi:MAG: hydrolase, partial [Paludibacter sp.]|nr:hydrolase [Paludibacter sp.]